MKTITVGFSRPKKWKILSYLIQKGQNTNYSHVYVKYRSDSLDRDIIYQASGLEVNFIGKELFEVTHVIVKEFTIQVSEETYKKVLQFSIDKAGMPYSIKQLFNILLYKMCKKSMFMDGRKAYVCSELVGEILLSLDIEITKHLDVIEPKDIYTILDEIYG